MIGQRLKNSMAQYFLCSIVLASAACGLQANDIVLKVLYGIQDVSEKVLEKQKRSIYKENDSELEKSKKFLQYLIRSNNYFVIQGIDFRYDVLRENKNPPLEYRKIPFQFYYKLFHRSIMSENDAFYTHRRVSYEFLLAKYETQFTNKLLNDVRRSQAFKTKLFNYFKYRWLIPYDKEDPSFKLMLKVEEGSKYKGSERLERAIANRLQEIALKSKSSSYKNEMQRLTFFYTLTQAKEKNLEWFIKNVTELVKYTSYPKSLSAHVANYVTKLLIIEIQAGNYKNGKKLFYTYMDDIVPHIGLTEKSRDVGSNALVLGILSKDDKISERVISTFVKNKPTIKHALLYYNVACYYASKKRKNEMLRAIKQSIKNGKDANDF